MLSLGLLEAQAAIDNSVTQRIWKTKYGVTDAQMYTNGVAASGVNTAWFGEDTDGDGITNEEEIAAGTNPFNPSKTLAVKSIVRTGNDAELQFPTESGKLYRVEATTTLTNSGSWTLQPPPGPVQLIGDGGIKSLKVPYVQNSFYRIRVDDFDSDNDGVSDWSEIVVELNPFSKETIVGVPDHEYVVDQLALPNLVTIKASKAFASEDGPEAGVLTVTRTQTLFSISVNYTVGGTALPNIDYTPLSGVVAVPSGSESVDIFVNPLIQAAVKGGRSVTATLTPPASPDAAFSLGSGTNATVIINDSVVAAGTGLLARYYNHANTVYAHAANFGDAGNYSFARSAVQTTANVVVTPTPGNISALAVGHRVRLSFNSGDANGVNNTTFNNLDYTVTAKTATTFTVSVSKATNFTISTTSGGCNYSIQSYTHPAAFERIDPIVDNEWGAGIPNGGVIVGSDVPDNYSSVWEGYLHPTTAGNYQFQLDADDKARVLIDLNNSGTFDLPGEQIVEHGWDIAATIGTFKQSAAIPLVVPGTPAQRYRIRVEHVETTGDARCRLQWRVGTNAYANIAQANVYTHTRALTNYTVTSQVATINTAAAHGLSVGNTVELSFSSGTLFTPPANYSGTYTVATVVDADTFTISVPGAANQTAAAGYMVDSTSGTTGWMVRLYGNTAFTAPPGRVAVDASGATSLNNGILFIGTPDVNLINHNTFSVRWSGQVQPQFSEEYTFAVVADDGATLRINGQVQELKMAPSVSTGTATYTYNSATGDTVVSYGGMVIKPDSYVVGESVRIDPTSGNLTHGTGSTYTYDGGTGNAVIDYSNLANIAVGGFAVGETVEMDPTSDSLSALGTLPYVITAVDPVEKKFTVNFGTGTYATGSGTINISDTRNHVITAVTSTSFTVNYGAAKYANGSTGNMNLDIVNKALKDWSSNGNERFVRIPMVGGVRYDIQLDYWENGGHARCRLYWFSASQPRQIIPAARLYPSNGELAPASFVSPTDAVAVVGGPFSYKVVGSNAAVVTISGNPAWLTYSGGVLSGTPPSGAQGDFQVLITLTTAAGTSTSVLNLRVEETGGTVVRENWTGITGSNVSSIPVSSPPASTANLSSLQIPSNSGTNYGVRIRGHLTAPITGNYYFWIAGSDGAELWISNDAEPVNAVKRAWINTGTAPLAWTGQPNQKSPWLALKAGQKYYFELLHKADGDAVTNPHSVAVGWLKPGETGSVPSEVVPGYALSPWSALVALDPGATVYSAILRPQGAVVTNASGNSFLRVNSAETEAVLTIKYSDLSSAYFGMHVHNDMIPGGGLSNVVADLDEPDDVERLADGSYRWVIEPTAGRTVAQIISDLKAGKLYFNVHSTDYPGGEIKGYYSKVDGSQTFTPPLAPPAVASAPANDADAVRFLTQATYGGNIADIATLKLTTYNAWIDDQFNRPASFQLAEVLRTEGSSAQGGNFDESLTFNAWWRNSIAGSDQLRQRLAFALSEILVVSGQGPLDNNAPALSYFYDQIADHAFGNFRDILEVVTLTPTMGRYLDMLRNDKPDLGIGRIPNENYGREIKQLFSIGLFRMWPDGTLVLNSQYEPIETYTQREIVGFSHAFTGWEYGYDGADRTTFNAGAAWTRQMRAVPGRHFTGPKRILNNEVLPGLQTLGNQPLDPYATHNSTQFNDPAYRALSAQELDATHDQLFNHPNVGPFICRQLIQRLVTSHPSRGYLYRVVQKFNNNGAGVRGDMKAVIKAILLDYEARHPGMVTEPTFGKQREPVMRVAAVGRAFRPSSFGGTYVQNGTRAITVTTTTPHLLASGNSVFLEFDTNDPADPLNATSDPAPWIGAYGATTPLTTTTFTVNAQGWATGTYSIPANSTTCTVTMSNHWLQVGNKVFVDFTSGTANDTAIDNTVYTVLTSPNPTSSGNNGNSFTFDVPADAAARTGNMMIPRFNPGSYTAAASGLAAPQDRRVTMDTNWDHHLQPGDQVQINFYGGNPLPVDMVATVDTVVDLNTWTFLAPSAGTNLGTNQGNNSVYQFPLLAQPLVRKGVINSRPSTFAMGNTDAVMEQTPLNSPTVFNFFLPDYKFPGVLAALGLTTPEFQETAETSVIRQNNFLLEGVLNPSTTNGFSSFRTGTNALVMDYSSWMNTTANPWSANLGLGDPQTTAKPWTNNENIVRLIDHLSTLLTAGQLSVEAKTIIRNFVSQPIASITAHATACTITTPNPHGYTTGDVVVISGVNGGIFGGTANALNSSTTTRTVTVTGATTFTIPLSCTVVPTSLAAAHVSTIVYNNATTVTTSAPSTTHKRDRLRAIIHLILTSPDYTIQR